MKTEITVSLYGENKNFAVIKLPDRKNPGTVFQADTLRGFLSDIEEVLAQLNAGEVDSAKTDLQFVSEKLAGIYSMLEEEVSSVGEVV